MQSLSPKIIFLEINEIPWVIINRYVLQRPSSSLTRIVENGHKFRCHYDSSVEDLSPWRTWPTVHRGVSEVEHQIRDLGQSRSKEVDENYPEIWRILSKSGISVGVMGSLHSGVTSPEELLEYEFYVPDTFSGSHFLKPSNLTGLSKLNYEMVKKSGLNVSRELPLKSALLGLGSLCANGLNFKTFLSVQRQLFEELFRPHKRVRRRSIQSRLFYDVYMSLLNSKRPDFSTFFTNHVASALHRYWAATFPNDFPEDARDISWSSDYAEEVWYAMDVLDDFLCRSLRFLRRFPDYELWIVSSMGQRPTEIRRVKFQMELTNPELFFRALGVNDEMVPVTSMFPQFNFVLRNASPNLLDEIQSKVENIRINGDPVGCRIKYPDFLSLDFGNVYEESNAFLSYCGRSFKMEGFGLSLRAVEEGLAATAYHDHEGVLIRYSGSERRSLWGKVSLKDASVYDIAPSILKTFGLPKKAYMRGTAVF